MGIPQQAQTLLIEEVVSKAGSPLAQAIDCIVGTPNAVG
jgi:hypothetical protein